MEEKIQKREMKTSKTMGRRRGMDEGVQERKIA
jgi:hypothetical protein